MNRPPLSPRLLRDASRHLQAEADWMLRLQKLAGDITAGGLSGNTLTDHQGDLIALAGESITLHEQRLALRQAISVCWQCPPEQVRLSDVAGDPSPLAIPLRDQRHVLLSQVTATIGSLRAAQITLGLWNTLIDALLKSLMGGSSERYSAQGRHVLPNPRLGITVRS